MKKILVIHGPNLDLLGKREPDVYGKTSLKDIDRRLSELAKKNGVSLETFQSNHEGEIVSKIGAFKKSGVLVINPAAYTHTSVAIRDAISASRVPTVEVHLSNIYAREKFRHESLVAPVARGQISGFGVQSYELGFLAALAILKEKKRS